MPQHRGYDIAKHPITGEVVIKRGRVEQYRLAEDFGFSDARAWVDRQFAEAAERERLAQWDAETERLFRDGVTKRSTFTPSARVHDPTESCPRCGTPYRTAYTPGGAPLPLDLDPVDGGPWVITGRAASGAALIRRARPDDTGDRYEVHHATCRRRLPLCDPATGQLSLRLGRWALLEARRTRHRRPRKQLSLLEGLEEQLTLPCLRAA